MVKRFLYRFKSKMNKIKIMFYSNVERGDNMQILEKTEYQDVYRVKDGVLLVINKFKPICYDRTVVLFRPKVKLYNKWCQKELKVLKEDYCDDYDSFSVITISKGTVVYRDRPVEIVDKSEWNYQIKTTGEAFSGNLNNILKLINDISEIIKTDN